MADPSYNEALLRLVLEIDSASYTHKVEKYCLNTTIKKLEADIDEKNNEIKDYRDKMVIQAREYGATKRELDIVKEDLNETNKKLKKTEKELTDAKKKCNDNDIYFNHSKKRLRESYRTLKESLSDQDADLENMKSLLNQTLNILQEYAKHNN